MRRWRRQQRQNGNASAGSLPVKPEARGRALRAFKRRFKRAENIKMKVANGENRINTLGFNRLQKGHTVFGFHWLSFPFISYHERGGKSANSAKISGWDVRENRTCAKTSSFWLHNGHFRSQTAGCGSGCTEKLLGRNIYGKIPCTVFIVSAARSSRNAQSTQAGSLRYI